MTETKDMLETRLNFMIERLQFFKNMPYAQAVRERIEARYTQILNEYQPLATIEEYEQYLQQFTNYVNNQEETR